MKQARQMSDRELIDELLHIAMQVNHGPIRGVTDRGRVSAITRQTAARMRSLISPTSKTGRAVRYLEQTSVESPNEG